ncbi:MAG TPA: amidohydrolase family protein [Steroidobacteraceae bacterium]|nr:amidohydrolase family protein [Steroidobacteraceae bacterium]
MRRFSVACLMLAGFFGAGAAWTATLAITHINVIDATGAPLQRDMTVIVRDGRIAELGKSDAVHAPAGAEAVDGSGKYLIPGLWDMHVHEVFGDWLPRDEKVVPPLFVANGITGVRDMGGDLDVLKEWRAAIAAGKLLGPRMIIAGPMLDGPVPRFPSSAPVANAADARRIVDDLTARGVDFIKIQSLIPRDGYFAAADEAKKLGIVFVGHVPDAVRASEASNAGQKSIEHFTGIFEGCSSIEDELIKGPKTLGQKVKTYDPARARALIALMAKNHTWQVPTLVWERGQWLVDDIDLSHDPLTKYAPASWKDHTWPMFVRDIEQDMDTDPLPVRKKFVQMELDMTLAMFRAGVPFLAGTDTAAGVHIFPGFSLHQELVLFQRAGLTPMQALQTATLNPAKFMGRTADLGTVEKGKLADLVLLDANPLEDIANTQRIRGVVLAGRYFDRAALDRMLHGVEEAAAAEPVPAPKQAGTP